MNINNVSHQNMKKFRIGLPSRKIVGLMGRHFGWDGFKHNERPSEAKRLQHDQVLYPLILKQ